jgi:hypothetical protein
VNYPITKDITLKQYTLHINNTLVAALDPTKASLSADYELMDVSSISDRKSHRTQQFYIPATPELQQALGFPENYHSVNAASQNQLIIGQLKEDGETIIHGRIKYHGSTIDQLDTYYRLSIIGDNNVWAYLLSRKRLRHLDLYNHTHAWTQAIQEANETPNANKPFIYPLIATKNIGRYFVHAAYTNGGGLNTEFQIKGAVYPADFTGYDIEVFGFEHSEYNNTFSNYTVESLFDGINSRIIVNGLAFNGNYDAVREFGYIRIVKSSGIRIRTTDRYPIIRVSDLITQIFNDIGYRVQSDYNTHILSKIYIAYEYGTGFKGQQRHTDFALFKAGIIEDKALFSNTSGSYIDYDFYFDDTKHLNHFDNGQFFDVNTHSYAPKIAYRQNFQFAFAFQVQGSATLSFFIESTNLGTIASITNVTYSDGIHTVQTITNNWNIINETDTIKVVVRVHQADNDVWFRKGNCFFYNEIRYEPKTEGDNVYLVHHLPDVSQLEFFKAIVQLDGLMIMTDTNSKTVYLENYDNFIDRSQVVDWTSKTDASKLIEDNPVLETPPAGVWYQYLEDANDVDTQTLKKDFAIVFGSQYEDYINELFAASYAHEAPGIGLDQTKLTRIVTQEVDALHECRILHYDGLSNLEIGALAEDWTQNLNIRTTAPIPYFQDDSIENDHSLHYEDGIRTKGLAWRNFGTLQKEINESRMISLHLTLNAYDIAQFVTIDNELKRDFRAVFRIKTLHGVYLCRLLKIENYNPLNTSTKCYFIPLTDSVYKYEHSNNNGEEVESEIE